MSGHQSIHPPYRISPGKAQESSSYPREILVKIDKTRRESCQPPWVLHQGFICPWMVASTKNQAHIPVKYSIRLIRQARNGNRTNRILLRLLLGLEVKTRSNQEGIPASRETSPHGSHLSHSNLSMSYSPTKLRNGAFLLAKRAKCLRSSTQLSQ